MRLAPLVVALSSLASLVSLSVPARADDARPLPVDDADVRDRSAAIERSLAAGAPYARRWYWGWSGAFVAASALSFASLSVVDEPGLRADAVVGGTLAGLGAISTIALPLTASRGAGALTAMPDDTPEQRAARLRAAEATLRRAAREERFLSGWAAHAGVLAANAAAAAVSRLAYDRPWNMIALARGTGVVVGELKVLSTPVAAIDAEATLLTDVTVAPTVGGLVVAGRF